MVLLRMEPFGQGEQSPVRPGLAQSRGGMGWEGHTTGIQPEYKPLINLEPEASLLTSWLFPLPG